ncbi:MAG TPA: hypothetical protein VHB77_21160, partial [Planctomycetaceae bacterium]|nr:hypothetical protein [Planctomycetaceae bacterium]
MCLIASSGLVSAQEAAGPIEPEPVLKYDPEFPDSMVVATVNSEPITVREVLEPFRSYLEEKFLAYEIPPEKRGEIREAWVKFALADVIERKLQVQSYLAELNEKERKVLEEHVERGWLDFAAGLQKKRGLSTMQELADAIQEKG